MLHIKSKGLGFNPHPGHGDFLRVRDRCIRTLINHSQDLGMSRLRSIIHKTWAYQDSNKSSQVIGIHTPINHSQDLGISIKTRSIIRKTWTYQDSNQSFTRLISRLQSTVHKTWAYQDSDQSFARLGHIRTYAHYELHMPVLPMIDQRLMNDKSKYGYAKVLQMIGVRICPNLANY